MALYLPSFTDKTLSVSAWCDLFALSLTAGSAWFCLMSGVQSPSVHLARQTGHGLGTAASIRSTPQVTVLPCDESEPRRNWKNTVQYAHLSNENYSPQRQHQLHNNIPIRRASQHT